MLRVIGGRGKVAERELTGVIFWRKGTHNTCYGVKISGNFRETLTQGCGRARKQADALSLPAIALSHRCSSSKSNVF